ncbi:hypothetical protein L6164_005597 [Bauhinia variegata]|uniref:Uncharacterized protein n=1 Tax=Bauhinia variegata TaxID=167791 RepID=A0ACB9PT81_BAUVA|nr:hypothetical protein L6164_005597 [Bauhinia variegata]
MNNGTINSTYHNNDSLDGGFSDAIIFTLGTFFLFLTCLWASCRLNLHLIVFHVLSGQEQQTGAAADHSAEVNNRVKGLDEAIIHGYPKILYSQVQNGDSVSSCCSICLVDFKEDDELRMLPDCGHFYHVNCIDSWLKLHPTCPICRNLPVRASESSMPAEEVSLRVE